MEELFIETENGNMPINKNIIKKYDLKQGSRSPFSRNRIVGKNGEFNVEKPEKNDLSIGSNEKEDILFSTAEVIDIAQGADSTT